MANVRGCSWVMAAVAFGGGGLGCAEAPEESFELSVGSGEGDSGGEDLPADGDSGDPGTTAGAMINCGNGIVDGAEACDGVELQGITCEDLGRDGGSLACSDCTFDVFGCGAPVGMVLLPAGSFMMGSNELDAYDDEQPARQVYVSAFWIDRTEVTVAACDGCVDAGACSDVGGADCNYGTTGRRLRLAEAK